MRRQKDTPELYSRRSYAQKTFRFRAIGPATKTGIRPKIRVAGGPIP